MRAVLRGSVVIAAAFPLMAALTQPVKIEGGLVSGAVGKNPSITVFKGIPFAAPPAGDLRWRAPKPVIAWPGVKKATEFGNNCIQNIADEKKPWTHEFLAHGEVSEDCLYLNIWTPAKSAKERRPVYVFIHGGANIEGSGSVPVYNGEGLASKGIIVVTVNYRLGLFGFFTHPELTKESDTRSSGNYALLDLIAALAWVHDNIAGFGGDPSRVTIGGQSAGASNVHSLTASPLAKGMFHRAIAESGSGMGVGPMGTRTLAGQEQSGIKFAGAAGAQSIADLRSRPWKELITITGFRFGVVVDGYVLPASVNDIFAQGKQNDVPTLTGCNKHEGGASPHPRTTAEAFQKQARQRYGELSDELVKLYPAETDEQARIAQNEVSWDQARVSMYLWALNRAKTARSRAYTYFWDHVLPGPDSDKYGAFHTSEVPYVMNSLAMSGRPFTESDRKIAATLSSYIVNFITAGDPNGKGLPHWPAVSEQPGTTMEAGDIFAPIPTAGGETKLAFFERYFAAQGRPKE